MNKADLVEKAADAADIPKKEAEKAVNAVFDGIAEGVAGGDSVRVANFGTFERRYRKPGTRRNPQTGETWQADGYYKPNFKPAKQFNETVGG